MELADFLRERLDEDEAAAKAAAEAGDDGIWGIAGNVSPRALRTVVTGVSRVEMGSEAEALHVVHHDPARVLREVAAKRAILVMYREYESARYPDFDGGYASAAEDALKHLAAVWSDHPGYRAEWKP